MPALLTLHRFYQESSNLSFRGKSKKKKKKQKKCKASMWIEPEKSPIAKGDFNKLIGEFLTCQKAKVG